MGCAWKESHAKEVWVRVVGLPLHLWSREVFKRIGECCGGFVAVDEETVFFSQLQWAWILVKASGKKWPGSLQVVAGNTSWELSLWWEASPWVSQVELSSWLQKRKWCEVRDESGGGTRVGASVHELHFEIQNRESNVQVECGRRQRTANGVGGRPALAPAAGSSMSGPRPKSVCWEALKVASETDLRGAMGGTKGLSSLSHMVLGWGKVSKRPLGPLIPEAQPSLFREPFLSRAPSEIVGDSARLEQELLAVEGADVRGSSLGRLKLTDEALLDEASKYPLSHKLSLLSLGPEVSSSSTPFLGPDVVEMGTKGASSGLFGSAEGVRSRVPLRNELMEDFSAREGRNKSLRATLGGASVSKLAIIPFESGFDNPLMERMALQMEEVERDEGWCSNYLAKFSRCQGMPTEGFEEEILYLLRRMKGRIEQKS